MEFNVLMISQDQCVNAETVGSLISPQAVINQAAVTDIGFYYNGVLRKLDHELEVRRRRLSRPPRDSLIGDFFGIRTANLKSRPQDDFGQKDSSTIRREIQIRSRTYNSKERD
jgi:hypothetical protein